MQFGADQKAAIEKAWEEPRLGARRRYDESDDAARTYRTTRSTRIFARPGEAYRIRGKSRVVFRRKR